MSQNNANQPLHVVLGASGGAGLAILQELISQGKNVRGVNSSGKKPAGVNAEFIKADATNLAELQKACEGASYVYHCIGLPYEKWVEFMPVITNNVIQVATQTKAKLIYIDNLYAYGPVNKAISEDMPYLATDTKSKMRGELTNQYLQAHADGKIQVTIPKGTDFFGPNTVSHLGDYVFKNALQNKPAQNIGNPDKLHAYIYIKDFARAVVFLAQQEKAYGQVWHIPNNPETTSRNLINIIYAELKYQPKIASLNRFMLTILYPFMSIARQSLPILHIRDRDYIVDSSKFEKAFGKFPLTPFKEAIHETLEWYKSQ